VVVFLSVATILAFIEVVLRYAFFTSLPWSSEIVIVCIIWAVFIGLSITLRKGGHIRVEVIVDLLSGKKKFTVVLLASLIGFIFAVVLFLYSTKYAAFLKDSGEKSITTDIPEYIYFLALPVGGLLFSIRCLVELIGLLGQRKKEQNISN
jgi:C4-dicarboxylate transporter DctQ subunit